MLFHATLGAIWGHFRVALELLWAHDGDFGPLMGHCHHFRLTLGIRCVSVPLRALNVQKTLIFPYEV